MVKTVFIGIILSLSLNKSYSQSTLLLDSLLIPIVETGNSKDIITIPQAKEIIQYGDKVLPALAAYFSDTTQTGIKSECQNLYLTKGEIAMILADRIELMPYNTLTVNLAQACGLGRCRLACLCRTGEVLSALMIFIIKTQEKECES